MTADRSRVLGGLSILLSLVPYVGVIALLALAATGGDISNAAVPYFVISIAASCVAIVLGLIVMRSRDDAARRGTARWGFALAMIYLATTGLIVGVVSQLA